MHFCDLHTHSTYSDGTFTPAQIIDEAISLGLKAVALCDHNTVAGLSDFIAAAEGKGISTVPGVEFTTDYDGTELHILGLFISEPAHSAVNAKLDEYNRRKDESNKNLIAALSCKGYNLDYTSMKASTPNGNINRAHIGSELTRLGYTESVQHAFKTLLSEEIGYYVPPKRPDAFEIIGFIKSIGAVAVLAHPLLNLDVPSLRVFLGKAKEFGLDGMETIYSLYTDEETVLAKQLADEFDFLQSGGSDFHGATKPDISLGKGKGNLEIPIEFYNKLCEAI